jgi:tRNA(Ile)-lysidine synthase
MKDQFLKFISEHQLCTKDNNILLTVSGGIDSMCMLHLFHSCGYNIAIAHCNFGLRGAESDGDEEFISRTAQNMRIPIHINRLDTLTYSEQHKISIQMAARELRYNWFDQLAKENNYSHIATAHNANDVAETFFINLTRGSGIHGLTGIKIKNNNIIRPLLFADRKGIKEFVSKNNIAFREDSSNADTKYMRNSIRHNIIPEFEKLNASFVKNAIHTTRILSEAEKIFNNHIKNLSKLIISEEGNLKHFGISEMLTQELSPALLFELLSPYGFTFDTAERMIENIHQQPGAVYFAENYKIVKDRTSYILYPLQVNEHESYSIEEGTKTFNHELKLSIQKIKTGSGFELKRNREVGTFDADKLTFPLTLRRWKHGDFFYPFGMRGKKKLSDYFSDQKVSVPEKENTWILCSGDAIVWVVNHRTDNRFRVTNNTKEVIQIEVKH